VLSQKWGILYLLHQLADSDQNNRGGDSAEGDADSGRLAGQRDNPSRKKRPSQDEQVLKDAFATAGLPRLPAQGTQRKKVLDKSGPTQRRDLARDTAVTPSSGGDDEEAMEMISGGPSEAALLHDLPFTLQGLSTKNLPFTSTGSLDLPTTLSLPIISLLHTLAEPSLLYRNLSDFVQSEDQGLVGQSLRSAIGNELRSYLGLISTLEGEIRRAISSFESQEAQGRIGKGGVTLKRCVIWTREATMGLRLMSLMVEEAKCRISMILVFC